MRSERETKQVQPLPKADDPIWALGHGVVRLLAAYLDDESPPVYL